MLYILVLLEYIEESINYWLIAWSLLDENVSILVANKRSSTNISKLIAFKCFFCDSCNSFFVNLYEVFNCITLEWIEYYKIFMYSIILDLQNQGNKVLHWTRWFFYIAKSAGLPKWYSSVIIDVFSLFKAMNWPDWISTIEHWEISFGLYHIKQYEMFWKCNWTSIRGCPLIKGD